MHADHKDFFISYNGADENWATWVAWQLEQAGYSTVIQAWDFKPGSNFVLEMQQAAAVADRTIMILSPNYLGSHFAAPEWAAAFAQDPEGYRRRLVPVRVAPCAVEGVLKQLVYIDLVGYPMDEATARLIAGLSPGRAKPSSPPPFPGPAAGGAAQAQAVPAARSFALDWRPLSSAVSVTWRSELSRNAYGETGGPTKIELQLVPVEGLRLEVRRLQALARELADLGRQHGVFSATQALDADATDEIAYVRSTRTREDDEAGLIVTRAGQRGAWITLPHDGLGSVLDPSDMGPRIAALLRTLMTFDLPVPARFAIGTSIGPTMMLVIGSSELVGRRSSASMGQSSGDVVLVPEDSLPAGQISSGADDVADEVIARLMAALRRS